MARYIDADKLIEKMIPHPILEMGCPEPEGIEEFILWLDMAETEDVEKVIRCKDCRHATSDERTTLLYCGATDGYQWHEPDHYCSYGEKKEGEKNDKID